jgi:hypothetical protein
MDINICWSIDCESIRREINDIELGKRAVEGFCDVLESSGWVGTLFLMPEELSPLSDLIGKKAEKGHEIALHLHPEESGYRSGYLGVFSYEEQLEIIGRAVLTFEKELGTKPVTARPGYGSANDHTFRAFYDSGFEQTSASFPGRILTSVASNWAGAPLYAHYTDPNNRFLSGSLDLVELPFSVDTGSMIWGGIHPQDLRVELTDAKNHGFTIRKIMKNQIEEKIPMKAILPFTHNIFEYSDPNNFRRETMIGMNHKILEAAKDFDLETRGITIAKAAAAFREVHENEA